MARFLLFFGFAVLVAITPVALAWWQASRPAGEAGEGVEPRAAGYTASELRRLALWYAVAVAVVGTLTTVTGYWPLTVFFVVFAAALWWTGRRAAETLGGGPGLRAAGPVPAGPPPSASPGLPAIVSPARPSVSTSQPAAGDPAALEAFASLQAAETARRSRAQSRALALIVATVSLVFMALFAFAAATEAAGELPYGAGDRSPEEVAKALLEGSSIDSGVVGTIPAGRPDAGLEVAILKAPDGGGSIDYVLATRTDSGAWAPIEGVGAFSDAGQAVDEVVTRFGIERFTLVLAASGLQSPLGGSDPEPGQ